MIFIYTIYFEELVIAFSEILSNRLIVESLKMIEVQSQLLIKL